jgi:DNA-binding MarR family transcriptional regulator
MVTEAVLALDGGATVNRIARELGLDQSGASRMVAAAVKGGYLAKTTDADARLRLVAVTPKGRELPADAHAWQETVFGELTADWPAEDVARFTELMRRPTRATPPT